MNARWNRHETVGEERVVDDDDDDDVVVVVVVVVATEIASVAHNPVDRR